MPNKTAQTHTPFKEWVNADAVTRMASRLHGVHSAFDAASFVNAVTIPLHTLELKDRVRLVSAELHRHLPTDFPQAVRIIRDASDLEGDLGRVGWAFCQFVEDHGLDHFDESMAALRHLTPKWTAEFAVRPFLLAMPNRTLAVLTDWTSDANHHVRRLISEGTRTRLPWGQRLPHFIADPAPVFALLERLRDDDELYVRRSVANNLNDLSKDHPAQVVQVAQRWTNGGTEHHAWMARHALRTLVKKGDADALAALGYASAMVELALMQATDRVVFGDALTLDVVLVSTSAHSQRLMIDYAVHHVKKNGKRTAKVFKWSKRDLKSGERLALSKRHTFKPISTRVYYPGTHAVEVLVNGASLGVREFELEL